MPSARFSSSTLTQLEPSLHRVIKEFLGFSEDGLLRTALDTLQAGGEEESLRDTLAHKCNLEGRKADKLAARIWNSVDDFCVAHDLPLSQGSGHRKRKARDDQERDRENGAKVAKVAAEGDDPAKIPATAMTSDQIRSMMANTLKQIAVRKKQLGRDEDMPSKGVAPLVGPQKPMPAPSSDSKAAAIAALQAQIAARLNKVGDKLPVVPVSDGPRPVILNESGQTVDSSGQAIQLSVHVPTLKANLRAKKRDEIKEHMKEGPSQTQAIQESKFFDNRVVGKGAARTKRAIKFNDPGKFQMEGKRLRMKAQLEKLQADISTTARKTGITSATQLAKLVPKDAGKGRAIPDVEWWDAHILVPDTSYEDEYIRDTAITNLIEHPIQMKPLEPHDAVHVPVFLTKKERKKLRRQSRREAWKEKQDKIRLGLLSADEPKVKMSNLMRVLGNEAIQDPTKIEAHVRKQMAERLAGHEKMNADRKLTPEQRKEKNARKMKEDTTCGVGVCVYRVKSLANPSKKFKVETNANQLYMTGCMVLYEDVNVIVVEGGPKQQKKYRQLMLNRIKWEEEVYKDKDGVEIENDCVLVWEGEANERSFHDMKMKLCPTESFARDFFKKLGVEHYWDQAYSGAVLEATELL